MKGIVTVWLATTERKTSRAHGESGSTRSVPAQFWRDIQDRQNPPDLLHSEIRLAHSNLEGVIEFRPGGATDYNPHARLVALDQIKKCQAFEVEWFFPRTNGQSLSDCYAELVDGYDGGSSPASDIG